MLQGMSGDMGDSTGESRIRKWSTTTPTTVSQPQRKRGARNPAKETEPSNLGQRQRKPAQRDSPSRVRSCGASFPVLWPWLTHFPHLRGSPRLFPRAHTTNQPSHTSILTNSTSCYPLRIKSRFLQSCVLHLTHITQK